MGDYQLSIIWFWREANIAAIGSARYVFAVKTCVVHGFRQGFEAEIRLSGEHVEIVVLRWREWFWVVLGLDF